MRVSGGNYWPHENFGVVGKVFLVIFVILYIHTRHFVFSVVHTNSLLIVRFYIEPQTWQTGVNGVWISSFQPIKVKKEYFRLTMYYQQSKT